jgi:hypothetical protein
MANKQNVLLFRKNANLCEINREYPCLKGASLPRHLSTNSESLKTIPDNIDIQKLLNKITTEYQEKDLNNKQPKNVKEEIEVIELFHEEINNKLYRKSRHQMINKIDDEKDNTNES